jgi:hypothetical protein
MRRILSERSLVVVLFISALVVFAFAQENTKDIERKYMSPVTTVIPAPPAQSANNETISKPELPGTQSAE